MFIFFDTFGSIIQTGAVGAMLVVMIRWLKAKDRKSYQMIEEQNKERKEMYESHSEMVAEVTAALVNKNNTDEAMSRTLEKLVEELRQLREKL